MSLQDPISDMLTTIRNGTYANKISVITPNSIIKQNIARVLKEEGYIKNFSICSNKKIFLEIFLKYFKGISVIETITRISRPSLRQYKKKNELPKIMNGLGIAIISTSLGIMTDKIARKKGLGGEVICLVK